MKSQRSEKQASPAQIRYIAILSARLGVDEPRVLYDGEAGRMIRKMKKELAQGIDKTR